MLAQEARRTEGGLPQHELATRTEQRGDRRLASTGLREAYGCARERGRYARGDSAAAGTARRWNSGAKIQNSAPASAIVPAEISIGVV